MKPSLQHIYAYVLSLLLWLSLMVYNICRSLVLLLRLGARKVDRQPKSLGAKSSSLDGQTQKIYRGYNSRKEQSSHQLSKVGTFTTTSSQDMESSTTQPILNETSPQEWKRELPYNPQRVKRVLKQKP